jgi:Tol biopolymer transport system component
VIAAGTVGLLTGPGSAVAVVPSSNGAIVMSQCEDGSDCTVAHIWTIDPASGAERRVTTHASSWDDDPAVSPDGTRVAFQRCPTAGTCRIATVDIGGGSVAYLTPGTQYEDYPAFSPDGNKLVFSRRDATGALHLVVMNAAGGSEHGLTTGTASDYHAAWSPDGSTIAFQRSEAGVSHIHKVSASGGSGTPVTAGPNDYYPSFSPDGSRIVFTANHVVEIMRSNGANQHALTAPSADLHDTEPAFAPDGTQIVFERYAETTHASPLVVMKADGSHQHLISGPTEFLFGADWAPTRPAAATTPGSGAIVGGAQGPAHSAPAVTLGAPRRESVRNGRLHLFATSNEPALGVASGKIAIDAPAKSYRLHTTTALAANTRTHIRLRIPRKPLRAIRAALARHQKLRARILVRVHDGAGNVTTEVRMIRLKK